MKDIDISRILDYHLSNKYMLAYARKNKGGGKGEKIILDIKRLKVYYTQVIRGKIN